MSKRSYNKLIPPFLPELRLAFANLTPSETDRVLNRITMLAALIDYPQPQPFDRQRTKNRCKNKHI